MSPSRAFLFLIIINAASYVNAADLSVRLDAVVLPSGKVLHLELYRVLSPERKWDQQENIRRFKVSSPLPAAYIIGGVEPGQYALRGFVDEDGDGSLALYDNGRPSEPFGYSHSVARSKASLFFRHAIFDVDEGGGHIVFSIMGQEAP